MQKEPNNISNFFNFNEIDVEYKNYFNSDPITKDKESNSTNNTLFDFEHNFSNPHLDEDSTELSFILNELRSSCRTDYSGNKLNESVEIINILNHNNHNYNYNYYNDTKTSSTIKNGKKTNRINLKNKVLKSKTFSYSNNKLIPERVSNPFSLNFLD